MAKFQNIDPELLSSLNEAIQATLANFQNVVEPYGKAIQNFAKSLQDVPESTKILAEYGWYLPIDFHPLTVNYYADELKKRNFEFVDKEMVALIDNEIVNIEAELVGKFPKREAALRSAFRAHNDQEYYLSIPVFYAQTEGICTEITGFRFFSIQKGQPATAAWAENLQRVSIMDIVLEPLKHTGIARQKQDLNHPLGINRHDVLHGDSMDYGEDKINSYKALSLLNYLGETVYLAKQDFDVKNQKSF